MSTNSIIRCLNSYLFSQIFAVSENSDIKAPTYSKMDPNMDSRQAFGPVYITSVNAQAHMFDPHVSAVINYGLLTLADVGR